MKDSLVIIPTFNEKENIEKIIRKVFSLNEALEILIVDDDSPDGTGIIVHSLISEFDDQLHILNRKEKNGLGTAYIAGFKWALRNHFEYIFEMDADFSHNPEDLPRLRTACMNGADLSIGSRYVKNGKVKDWPMARILISYFASLYARMVLWFNIKDTTAGFKCYTRKVLETIDLDNVKFVGYAFQIEMKYRAYKKGFKLVEIPITFKDRTEGKSKMSMGIFKEAFFGILQLRFMNFT